MRRAISPQLYVETRCYTHRTRLYKFIAAADAVRWSLMSPDEIVSSYDTSIVVRRWLGAWVDFIALLLIFLIPDLISNDLYRAGLPVWMALAVLYFPVLESWKGRTLGKIVTRTVIVDGEGRIPRPMQAIVRTLFRLIEVNPLLAGGIPAGLATTFSRKRQRLGDMIAGTYVIKSEHIALLGEHLTFVPTERLAPRPRSGLAVMAGYLGLCSIIILPAPIALALGVLALRDLKRRPHLSGRAGAIFGIVMGALGTLVLIWWTVAIAIGT